MRNVAEIEGNCTGCGACGAVCGVNAIEFRLNEKGFFSPCVSAEKCSHCGLCAKVCAKTVRSPVLDVPKSSYAIQSKNRSVLETSTSGGAAYHFAEYWLQESNTCLVGTQYNKERNCAEFISIDRLSDYVKVQGSKYLQADTTVAIRSVMERLADNPSMRTMIVGTPCQIYGISRALRHRGMRDRACCVELFCHGVPSYHLWNKYRSEQEKKHKAGPDRVEFRSKRFGWHMYTYMEQYGEKKLYLTSDQSVFYDIYFDKVALNICCLTCPFYRSSGEADLKIGDFWGPIFSKYDDGVSAVIPMSTKGEAILGGIQENVAILGKYDSEEVFRHQSKRPYDITPETVERVYRKLQCDESLASIRREYRKVFSGKQRFRLFLKQMYSRMPIQLRKNIKQILSVIQR